MRYRYKDLTPIFSYGRFAFYEMPDDVSWLISEGKAMNHCLQVPHVAIEYARRLSEGSQRQFSMVDTAYNALTPVVDIELSLKTSSYAGPVDQPSVTQIRGYENECPPKDAYLDAIAAFFSEVGRDWHISDHSTPNFDGQCDGKKFLDRLKAIAQARRGSLAAQHPSEVPGGPIPA